MSETAPEFWHVGAIDGIEGVVRGATGKRVFMDQFRIADYLNTLEAEVAAARKQLSPGADYPYWFDEARKLAADLAAERELNQVHLEAEQRAAELRKKTGWVLGEIVKLAGALGAQLPVDEGVVTGGAVPAQDG